MSERSNPRRLPFLGILALVIIGGLCVLFVIDSANEKVRQQVEDTGPTLAELAELKNVGIANLENNDLIEADKVFVKMAEILPDERIGFQNLAITRLLKIAPENMNRAEDEERYRQELDKTESAVLTLLSRFPNEPDAHILSARFAQTIGDSERAISEYEEAVKLDPRNAAAWYGIFEAGRYSRNEELEEKGNEALGRAWELAPKNLHVMREWLAVQARAQDSSVEATLKNARELIAPFAEKILLYGRVDLNDLIDKGIAAVAEENWGMVTRSAIMVGNMLRPEVATQNDTKKVNPHPLEFILYDFSDEFHAKFDLPKPELPEGIPVKFTKSETALGQVAGAKQVEVVDFDLDGSQDVFVLQEGGFSVWSQSSGEGKWSQLLEVKLQTGEQSLQLRGACLFDLDRDAAMLEHDVEGEKQLCADADLDVIVYGASGMVVLRNDEPDESAADDSGKEPSAAARVLTPVEQDDEFLAVKNVLAVLPVDFDHDGDLDLVASSADSGISLWLNRDDSTFAPHSQYSVLPPEDARIRSLIAVDWDRNVSIDVLAFGERHSGVLTNILHGRLRWEEFPEDLGLSGDVRTAALIDADSNFSWDLLAVTGTGSNKSGYALDFFGTANPDAGVIQFKKKAEVGSGAECISTLDYDNDGFQDVLHWDGRTVAITRGGPQASFQAVSELTVDFSSDISACATADIDSDGDVDVVVACAESVEVLINDGGNANNWIDIPIRSEDAKQAQKPNERVNIHGIGSLLELRAGLSYQPQVVTGRSTHFGLGKLETVDSARVLWTNGIPEHIVAPAHGQTICLQQQLKGSCPYLYTWDGEKFVFYTDCLWAAPVGLQFADGVLAQPREWEYLKVSGDRLKEKNGEYVLRMTEELWEIGYFDSVRLLAVDHPADVDIYSNEKVGPPSVSEFKIHTVRKPRMPVSAKDQAGRDVLSKVAEQDRDFVQCFDRRIKQGLTEPHFLELDLGELDDPQDLTLFLTGWIRPTDTSLNVAISQRPDLESTQPPSILVPDEKGEWVNVRPYMGFPGGKTKTIAVNLSGIFPTADYRVRIATSMEIYWDHVFFSADEEPVEIRTTEMPLTSANLRYRGFSTRIPHAGLGPESYDYYRLDLNRQWPPMEGLLTTYGDVTELVGKIDNRQALLGAGDEMELRFESDSAELPEGWTRDFILHNVGWDKDADLNTVFGQTVGPLPFSGMKAYPDPDGAGENEPFAAQTRRQSRSKFWRMPLPAKP